MKAGEDLWKVGGLRYPTPNHSWTNGVQKLGLAQLALAHDDDVGGGGGADDEDGGDDVGDYHNHIYDNNAASEIQVEPQILSI